MNSAKRFLGLLFLVSLLAGCSFEDALERFLPKEESAFALECLDHLRNKNLDEVKKRLSGELLTPEIDSQLLEASSYFPNGDPIEVKVVGCNVVKFPNRMQAKLSYQYQFEDGWAVADIVLLKENGRTSVTHIWVNRLEQSLEEINTFTFSGKGIFHYLFLIFVGVIPVFIIYSLIICARTPMQRRKWLWIIFILLGFVGINLNWTTGQIWIKFLSFHLLGAGALRASPYAPWMMTISIPLGAILFLAKRKSLTKQETPVEQPETPI